MDTIKEGQHKKWQIIMDGEEWIGHSPDTKQMILFRKVNELIKAVNRLEKALGMVARQHSKDAGDIKNMVYDESLRKIVKGDDYLEGR